MGNLGVSDVGRGLMFLLYNVFYILCLSCLCVLNIVDFFELFIVRLRIGKCEMREVLNIYICNKSIVVGNYIIEILMIV